MSLPVEHSLPQLPIHVRNAVVNGAYTKIGVVRSVIAQDGLPGMAIVDFDDETGVETKLMSGTGTPTHPGMTVRVERQGGVIDPTWKIVDVLSGPRISFGEPIAALMAKPVIPGASFGGVYTESQTATTDNPNAVADPGAPPKARLYLYPRSIVPSSYSAYQQRAKAIRVQGRELGDTEWPEQYTDWPLNPANTLWSVLAGSVTSSSTTITLTVPLDRVNELLVDQPAYWQIEAEVLLAIATNNGGGSVTLTVVAHNGVDDASLGQGFVTSALGRGVDGTDAASHTAGVTVILLSAMVAPDNLRPGTDYEVRVAFVNASNQAGPWSDIVGVTTWEQPVPPAAPASLVVAHLSSAFQAQWDPVVTDANGDYRSDVKRYLAVRHTAALAVGLSLAQVLSAGATQVADTPATVISVPATKGNGNFIGVAAVGSEGLISEWDWGSDTTPPPSPDPANVTFTSVPNGVLVNIDPADTADEDPGFKEFLLWKASDSAGSSATAELSFKTLSTVYSILGSETGWYKVTSTDWAGNYGLPGSTGWKFCKSEYPDNGIVPYNGDFQLPNTDQSLPIHWTITNTNPSTFPGSYVLVDGLRGDRAIKAQKVAGASTSESITLLHTIPRPWNPYADITVSFWLRALTPGGSLTVSTGVPLFVNENGSGSGYPSSSGLGVGFHSIAGVPTSWTRYTATLTPGYVSNITAKYYQVRLTFTPNSVQGSTYEYLIDDVQIAFTPW